MKNKIVADKKIIVLSRAPTILVVDDNKIFADLTARQVEIMGYNVVKAVYSPAEALAYLLAANVEAIPDVIIADFHMPGMDGLGFLNEVSKHSKFRGIPSIVMSGDVGNLSAVLSNDYASGFLLKPFTVEHLLEEMFYVLPHQLPETVKNRFVDLQSLERSFSASNDSMFAQEFKSVEGLVRHVVNNSVATIGIVEVIDTWDKCESQVFLKSLVVAGNNLKKVRERLIQAKEGSILPDRKGEFLGAVNIILNKLENVRELLKQSNRSNNYLGVDFVSKNLYKNLLDICRKVFIDVGGGDKQP